MHGDDAWMWCLEPSKWCVRAAHAFLQHDPNFEKSFLMDVCKISEELRSTDAAMQGATILVLACDIQRLKGVGVFKYLTYANAHEAHGDFLTRLTDEASHEVKGTGSVANPFVI